MPARASTQTWMMLTFALFIGAGVLVVVLYVAFILRADTREATRSTLAQQVERIAIEIEQAGLSPDTDRLVEEISRLTGLQIAVAWRDSVIGAPTYQDVFEAPLFAETGNPGASDAEGRFARAAVGSGDAMLFMALYRPAINAYVIAGQPVPPLLSLVRRIQAALILSLVMVLILAMIGSWIASNQITRPLQAIRDSARSISEGKFEERIRVDSRATEFQDLARRLNHMSSGFREKIDELQRVTQIQNEFIGNVSHEVRNPIFAVGGYLEALSATHLKDEQRTRYVEKALANLQRLNNLFNDLIEIARLEYREDLIQPNVFDLKELVDEVADMLRPKAQGKGLNLEAANPSIEVRADRNRLRQVLTNLIDNAIAYTDEGAVRCRYRRRLGKIRIEVIDTGRGIAEEHLERIFERFYRVDPDRSRKSGGTGLGLSIVKQILHAHGEQIHVESTFGRGSRFWFELPYAEAPVALEEV